MNPASTVEALVVTGYGINCEREMAHGFRLAGARATIVHLADLMDGRVDLQAIHILAIPGGFSFGDHLGSGRAFAARVRHSTLWAELERFIAEGKYVWGVCNGFQVMVQLGLLPALSGLGAREVTLITNASGRFEDRWVRLVADATSPCPYTAGLTALELPVRHGEGRLVAPPEVLERLLESGHVPLRYADAAGNPTEDFPENPNGSPGGIAGLCDATGRLFGLMPHPEAHVDFTHHPRWTRRREELKRQGAPVPVEGAGLMLFRNVVERVARDFFLTPEGPPVSRSTMRMATCP